MSAWGDGRRFWWAWRLVAAAAAVALVAGCSRGGPDRIPLRGSVQLGGQPLSAGSISVLPAKGQSGPAATTSIAAGRYAFTRENGPPPGPHRVIVQLSTPDKATMLSKAAGRAPQADRPKKTRWELQADVPDRQPFEVNVKLE